MYRVAGTKRHYSFKNSCTCQAAVPRFKNNFLKQWATMNFIQQFLNKIPIALLVFDEDSRILYMNTNLALGIGYQPEKLDEKFVKDLAKVGIKNLSYESLLSTVNRIIGCQEGVIETITTGKYSCITLVSVKIARDGKEQNHVLAILRGER